MNAVSPTARTLVLNNFQVNLHPKLSIIELKQS
jgi:hypothetical protein